MWDFARVAPATGADDADTGAAAGGAGTGRGSGGKGFRQLKRYVIVGFQGVGAGPAGIETMLWTRRSVGPKPPSGWDPAKAGYGRQGRELHRRLLGFALTRAAA
jgi:hypothetical protein